jgi:hypothetical protein
MGYYLYPTRPERSERNTLLIIIGALAAIMESSFITIGPWSPTNNMKSRVPRTRVILVHPKSIHPIVGIVPIVTKIESVRY